ncbi:hypothetical protein NMY22_g14948 [Coprinellus aureogranulatus]|nr:hypothetical protein NMY22_g14948 [Coprinellus aureogranulatus]
MKGLFKQFGDCKGTPRAFEFSRQQHGDCSSRPEGLTFSARERVLCMVRSIGIGGVHPRGSRQNWLRSNGDDGIAVFRSHRHNRSLPPCIAVFQGHRKNGKASAVLVHALAIPDTKGPLALWGIKCHNNRPRGRMGRPRTAGFQSSVDILPLLWASVLTQQATILTQCRTRLLFASLPSRSSRLRGLQLDAWRESGRSLAKWSPMKRADAELDRKAIHRIQPLPTFGQKDFRASTCSALFNASLWLVIVGANAAHTIIFMQTCALWENNRIVRWFLLSLLIMTFLSSVVLTSLQTKTFTFLEPFDPPLPITPGCRLMIGHFYSAYVYIMVLVSQAFTVGFMIFKGIQHVRQSRSSWVIGLYRNGVLYCVVILLLSLGNAIIPNVPAWAITYANLLGPLQHTMESILCSRVMFVILKRRKTMDRRDSDSVDADGLTGIFTSVMDAPMTAGSSAIELESTVGKSNTKQSSVALP